MGGGLSTLAEVDKDVKPHDCRGQLHSVNKFLQRSYFCCSQVEAINLLLSNEPGLRQFSSFVVSQNETDYFDLLMELEGIKLLSYRTVQGLQQQMRRIAEEYLRSESHRYVVIPSQLMRHFETILLPDLHIQSHTVAYVLDVIEQLRCEMVAQIAHEQFPSFLSSKYYQNWQANICMKGKITVAFRSEDGFRNKHADIGAAYDDEVSCGKEELVLKTLCRSDSWLPVLISAIETVPISFFLCHATNDVEKGDIPRFPVLYASKFVEKMFGFPRGEFVGKPFDALLHCAKTEDETVKEKEEGGIPAQLEALTQQNQVTSAVLTHVNSKGVPFKNLVASKPIFDPNGACVYKIYLMFALSTTDPTVTPAVSTHQNSDVTTLSALQSSDASNPAAHMHPQIGAFSAHIDRYAHDRIRAEKLLHILPDNVYPQQKVVEEVVQPSVASGPVAKLLGQLLPAGLFHGETASAGVLPQQLHPHSPPQPRQRGRALSIQEAKLSRGPGGRLGGAAPAGGDNKLFLRLGGF